MESIHAPSGASTTHIVHDRPPIYPVPTNMVDPPGRLASDTASIHKKTNVISSDNEVKKLLDRFAEEEHEGKPAVYVSGGGASGYSAAHAAAEEGANVLLVDNRIWSDALGVQSELDRALFRSKKPRTNVISVQESAVYSAARVGGNADLIRELIDKGNISISSHLVEENSSPTLANPYIVRPDPRHSFVSRILSKSQLAQRFFAKKVGAYKRDALGYGFLSRIQDGIADYHVKKGTIHILSGHTKLHKDPQATRKKRFYPEITLEDGSTHKVKSLFGLVCLSEGAKSPNREVIGGEINRIDPDEPWVHRNYRGPLVRNLTFQLLQFNSESIANIQHFSTQDSSIVGITLNVKHVRNKENFDRLFEQYQPLLDQMRSSVTLNNNSLLSEEKFQGTVGRSLYAINDNAVALGDAYAYFGPPGGAGYSFATSIQPEAFREMISGGKFFNATDEEYIKLSSNFADRIIDAGDKRQISGSEIMHEHGFYSPGTLQQVHDLSEISKTAELERRKHLVQSLTA
jgi:hypothetical protein